MNKQIIKKQLFCKRQKSRLRETSSRNWNTVTASELFQSKEHILKIRQCFKEICFCKYEEKNSLSLKKYGGGWSLEISNTFLKGQKIS